MQYDGIGRITRLDFPSGGFVTYAYNDQQNTLTHRTILGAVYTYRYSPFGMELTPGASDSNSFRFAGEYWDAETQTYYLRARRFNPRTGRFTQPDPHWGIHNMQSSRSAILQSGNLFMYVMHNQVRFIDSSGLFAVSIHVPIPIPIPVPIPRHDPHDFPVFPINPWQMQDPIHYPTPRDMLDALVGNFPVLLDWMYSVSTPPGSRLHPDSRLNAQMMDRWAHSIIEWGITINTNTGRHTITNNHGVEIDITPSPNHRPTRDNRLKGDPNSSVDIVNRRGYIVTRRWFGEDGNQIRDVDFTNHGNPSKHPQVPHEHGPRPLGYIKRRI